jgi:hypothetical protein
LKQEDVIATNILQSLKIYLKIIAIVAMVKYFMSVSHITVVVNTVLYPLQLTAKIIVTTSRNRTNIHNMIESDKLVDLIPKTLVSKIVINWWQITYQKNLRD